MPVKPLQIVCDWECGHALIVKQRLDKAEKEAKAERKQIRERKEALKPLQYFLKRAQKAVNAYVVARDHDKPCISCGTWDAQAWHASHFISVGASSALRFDTERNIFKSCSQCNTHLSGNLVPYETALRDRIGADKVEALKTAPRGYKWTREELLVIESEAKAKLKEAQKKPEAA